MEIIAKSVEIKNDKKYSLMRPFWLEDMVEAIE